jgi:tRNA-(ms[2]io[6]A)-hydroxylase
VRTPDDWGEAVLQQPLALLNDHAHLEKKAASNALELLLRWPEPNPPENWVQAMNAIARDEVDHLAIVSRLLARRGGRLTKSHRNRYASELRDEVRTGHGIEELMDRLMVSALVEARSCERFEILSRVCTDKTLKKLYGDLWASEHGHYRMFLDLAKQVSTKKAVEKRWSEWLDIERAIIQRQPPGPRMHSWPPG